MCFYSNLLQLILYSAATVIFLKHAVSPLLQTLQWLLLAIRIQSKLLLATKAITPFLLNLPSHLPFLYCVLAKLVVFLQHEYSRLACPPSKDSPCWQPSCYFELSVNGTLNGFQATIAKVAQTPSLSFTLLYLIFFIALSSYYQSVIILSQLKRRLREKWASLHIPLQRIVLRFDSQKPLTVEVKLGEEWYANAKMSI